LELDVPGLNTLVALPKLARLALSKPGLPKLGISGGGEQVRAQSRLSHVKICVFVSGQRCRSVAP